jgi:hypothetical protein
VWGHINTLLLPCIDPIVWQIVCRTARAVCQHTLTSTGCFTRVLLRHAINVGMTSLSDQPIAPRPALRGSGAKTDSDLARPPSRKNLSGQPQARQTQSPSYSRCSTQLLKDVASRTTKGSRRGRAGGKPGPKPPMRSGSVVLS